MDTPERLFYWHSSGNNRADTVMKLFTKAVQSNGWPARVRSDMGGENVEVDHGSRFEPFKPHCWL